MGNIKKVFVTRSEEVPDVAQMLMDEGLKEVVTLVKDKEENK